MVNEEHKEEKEPVIETRLSEEREFEQAFKKQFKNYEIIEFVGKGGMGIVYKARQMPLDRLVALKILPKRFAQDPQFSERFFREAKAMAGLSHPNIVPVYDFGSEQGYYYFAMEFVEGANLRQILRERKLKPEEALRIVPQLCEALEYAHTEGVVHRDIKPENIMIDKKGRVKITDFGIAKIVHGEITRETITQSQMVLGTMPYIAPEQYENPKSIDHRADIYSLGVVIYEMLTGELPLGKFAPPSKKVEIDVKLDEVILKALEKNPEQRYQNVTELKDAITTVAQKVDELKEEVKRLKGEAPPRSWVGKGVDYVKEAVREIKEERRLAEQRLSTWAMISLVAGGLAVLCLLFGPLFLAVLVFGGFAIVAGLVAQDQIRRSQGRLYGKGYAMAGVILGIGAIGLSLVIFLIALIFGGLLFSIIGMNTLRSMGPERSFIVILQLIPIVIITAAFIVGAIFLIRYLKRRGQPSVPQAPQPPLQTQWTGNWPSGVWITGTKGAWLIIGSICAFITIVVVAAVEPMVAHHVIFWGGIFLFLIVAILAGTIRRSRGVMREEAPPGAAPPEAPPGAEPPRPAGVPFMPQRLSMISVFSLILPILSICMFVVLFRQFEEYPQYLLLLGIPPFLGFVFAIVGLSQIKRARGILWGQGFAIAGLVLSIFLLIAGPFALWVRGTPHLHEIISLPEFMGADRMEVVVIVDGSKDEGASKRYRMDPDGNIDVRYIGKIKVKDRDLKELKEELEKGFQDHFKGKEVEVVIETRGLLKERVRPQDSIDLVVLIDGEKDAELSKEYSVDADGYLEMEYQAVNKVKVLTRRMSLLRLKMFLRNWLCEILGDKKVEIFVKGLRRPLGE
jgi:tRNA A-37 threonylcarbamoyl transferase component Bud32